MAKDSLVKASTPEKGLEVAPGKSDNWIERAGPGGKGGKLPDYVEHIALAIAKKQGIDKSRAIGIAIGTIKRWAAGGGNVDATTRAAAEKALAEWEALKAKVHANLKETVDAGIQDDAELSDEDAEIIDSIDFSGLLEAKSVEDPPAAKLTVCPDCKHEMGNDGKDCVKCAEKKAAVVEAVGSLLDMKIDLGVIEAMPTGNDARRNGESLNAWATRVAKAHAKTGTRSPGTPSSHPKNRSGGDAAYDANKHPRGRGGKWTIKQGSSGEDVRTVQRVVKVKSDGKFGGVTKRAVMEFQREHGLQVDGIVGHQTAVALAGHYAAAKTAKVGGLKDSDRAKLASIKKRNDRKVKESVLGMRVEVGDLVLLEAVLSSKDRAALPAAAFVFPQTKRYPIHDESHAKNALARASGKPEESTVKAAVYAKYPKLKPGVRESVLSLRLDSSLRLVEATEIHEVEELVLVESADAGESLVLDLALVEAAKSGDVLFNDDGTVDFVIIRPCHGRGVANAIYEAPMLQRDAGVFAGLPLFDNHESEKARRARQGIPRPPSELGGEIRESWWDPSFSTPRDSKMGFDKGAVIGRCMLTEDMERLVRRVPRMVKTSVNVEATKKTPTRRNGKAGLLVEGIYADPERHSVDLVTTAGAGGEVAKLYEEMAA